jgi:hypothetical protein
MMKANPVTEIDAFSNKFLFVATLNLWFSKINITELHLIQSTVPLDLIHDQDNDFVDEIDEVDRIYFGYIEINLRDDISYSDLNDEDVIIKSSSLLSISRQLDL